MRHDAVSPDLFIHHREQLRGLLKHSSLVVLHANDVLPTNADGTIPFKQNTDLYHLTGIAQEETVLMLFPDAVEPKDREIIFVRETNDHIAVWEGTKLSKVRVAEISGVGRVEWLQEFPAFLGRLAPQAERIYLNTNEHLRAATVVETRNDRFIKECRARYPLHKYERLAPLMHRIRMIKHPEEIRMLQKACDITEAGFRRLLGFVKPGVGEWEIEAEMIHEYIRNGSHGFAYPPIIGSGASACVLHYVENDQRCKDGDLLLIDAAAEFGGWNADLTRTIPVNGKFTPRQRQVYDAVLRVYRHGFSLLRPGIKPIDYQKKIVGFMEGELVGLGLFTAEEAAQQDDDKRLVKKYFMHGMSHHLGLDVHDVSPFNEPVAEGMVFTIEPGIYIREENLGVRLENDVLIGKDANIDLMAGIPIEADEIEALMAAR
ncbi:MAG: aminopeptidase P family protein [Verrucomicrobiota bacterium]